VETAQGTGADVIKRIQDTRRELLDLSARNRLINTPRGTSRGQRIEIVDERALEVFRLLVRERKAMAFLPGALADENENAAVEEPVSSLLGQPEDQPGDAGGGTAAARHTDRKLQTRLASEGLQGRLLRIYYDAQTFEQEQGVSILYLAIGFLRWYEALAPEKARHAPLLLIPVDLQRASAASRFHLRYRDEDVTTNLSLQAKLRAEFGIVLPDVPEMDELEPEAYLDLVAGAISGQPGWEVQRNDMVLSFFSFAKYLMYRDLDPETWPAHCPLGASVTLSSLLGAGFVSEAPFCDPDDPIDRLIPPAQMLHIADADSSQAVVIEEVKRGRNLVVQGPPGTGKSQTITNLIAAAVNEGKKVLFVAEKMAALEVVQRRLVQLGLGAICLELHSSKASKREVLNELERTLSLGRPRPRGSAERIEALDEAITRLNRHADVLNTPLEPAGVTPFQVFARLSRLMDEGVEGVNLSLASPETWSKGALEDRCREVADLQKYIVSLGSPPEHPWRGVRRTELILPADLKALLAEVGETAAALGAVVEAADQLADALGLARIEQASLRDLRQLAQLGRRIVAAPARALDRRAIASPVWAERPGEIARLVQEGEQKAQTSSRLRETVTDTAWQTDLAATRLALARHGPSLFRWFRRDYRAAVRTLREICKGEVPRSLAGRLELIDAVTGIQEWTRSIDSDSPPACLGREAFGSAWKGTGSDWPALAGIVTWDAESREAGLVRDHRATLAALEQPGACQEPLTALSSRLKPAASRLRTIARTLDFDCTEGFGSESLYAVPIPDLVARLHGWRQHPEALSRWIGYQLRRRRLEEAGLGAIISGLQEGKFPASAALDLFQAAYYEALTREVFRRHPGLAEFDGPAHEEWIEEFRTLDRARIEMARGEVALAHYNGIPRGAQGGEMAVIRREIEKKRKHKPIRQLIREAGSALLAIKPVFLMSPISVAQYLEPGSLTFDMLLIDEASQVRPEDALGAMARARQVVVVGDDKQLPPTRFFNKLLDESSLPEDSDSDLNAGDLESILGLCTAQGMSERMLRWHYRSRHHSLIAVSNREFYDDRLHVVPSPTAVTASHGLHFRPVPGGVFDRGHSATNRVEAQAIAEAVIEHARRDPEKSLGVGAFSVSQRDAIRDELEVLERANVDLTGFFATDRPEPFFVKNLENIQGDERDVIFISVGYARDPSGTLTMNFGPLSSQGGERRLNVLISRARERLEVFSSINAADIDLTRARSRGAAAFKTFLQYAETGVLDAAVPQDGHPDTELELEEQIAAALEGEGYEVHSQVGTAGFTIDLAVVDPAQPDRYLLGIECDGATYHTARSARDRDRLRDMVLEDRGWQIHRVWSIDWLHRPEEQLRRIVAAIEEARAGEPEEPEGDEPGSSGPLVIERAVSENGVSEPAAPAWVSPYVEAVVKVPSAVAIPATNPAVLRGIIARVVEIEGPIHREEVARRVTSLWGLQRGGSRISEAIARGIEAGIRSGLLRAEADFLTHRQQTRVPVRCRSDAAPASVKKPEMLPPAELRQAVVSLVGESIGVRADEVPPLVARVLGFKATSAKLKERIEAVVAGLIAEKALAVREGKLFLA
jgi:very-short-patch-repair endonuclease